MGKKDVRYIDVCVCVSFFHSGTPLGHKKEWNRVICDNMDLVDVMLSEISQKEKNTVSLHLYVESKTQNKDKHKQNKANENPTYTFIAQD